MNKEERINELTTKLHEKRQERKEAMLNRDVVKHSEIMLQIAEIDKELTQLMGGIQCPES